MDGGGLLYYAKIGELEMELGYLPATPRRSEDTDVACPMDSGRSYEFLPRNAWAPQQCSCVTGVIDSAEIAYAACLVIAFCLELRRLKKTYADTAALGVRCLSGGI